MHLLGFIQVGLINHATVLHMGLRFCRTTLSKVRQHVWKMPGALGCHLRHGDFPWCAQHTPPALIWLQPFLQLPPRIAFVVALTFLMILNHCFWYSVYLPTIQHPWLHRPHSLIPSAPLITPYCGAMNRLRFLLTSFKRQLNAVKDPSRFP